MTDLLAGFGWRPLSRAPRRLLVECIVCGRGAVNETNRLRRANWQETVSGRGRFYRCADCATADSTPDGAAP